jgi:pimeloyl-ACP methyl ester carboxylesterase
MHPHTNDHRRPTLGGPAFLAAIAAARIAAHLPPAVATPTLLRPWLTPWSGRAPRVSEPATTLRTTTLVTAVGPLAAVEAGTGPTVLLLHGWGGRKEQMATMASDLAGHGIHAVALDLPFHGQSPGRGTTTIPDLADAITAVLDVIGTPAAIVAHSAGAMATAMAIQSVTGPRPVPIAAVAPMTSITSAMDVFCAAAGLPFRARTLLAQALEDRFPGALHDMNLSHLLADHQAPLMVLHDGSDIQVSPDDVAELAAVRPDARVLQVSEVGHHRILRDPRVVESVTRFVLRACGREQSPVALATAGQ